MSRKAFVALSTAAAAAGAAPALAADETLGQTHPPLVPERPTPKVRRRLSHSRTRTLAWFEKYLR